MMMSLLALEDPGGRFQQPPDPPHILTEPRSPGKHHGAILGSIELLNHGLRRPLTAVFPDGWGPLKISFVRRRSAFPETIAGLGAIGSRLFLTGYLALKGLHPGLPACLSPSAP